MTSTVRYLPAPWVAAGCPPKGLTGCWTDEVIVVTNFGNVYKIAYFNGDDSGVWQRPKAFIPDEQVECWQHMPNLA